MLLAVRTENFATVEGPPFWHEVLTDLFVHSAMRTLMELVDRRPIFGPALVADGNQSMNTHVSSPFLSVLALSACQPTMSQMYATSDCAGRGWRETDLDRVQSTFGRLDGQAVSESGGALLELIQEGSLGLLRAVDRFDHDRGFRFATLCPVVDPPGSLPKCCGPCQRRSKQRAGYIERG